MLPNKVRIVVGPEHMYVSRYGICSEDAPIENKLFTRADATDAYYTQVHEQAVKHTQNRLLSRQLAWAFTDKAVAAIQQYIADKELRLYFDAPSSIISIKPWKQAKHGEWFFVGKHVRNRLKHKVKIK